MSYTINQKAELLTDATKAAGFVFGYASKFNGVDSYDDTIGKRARVQIGLFGGSKI